MGDQPATEARGFSATIAAVDTRLRNLLSAIGGVVVVIGADHRILEWNPEAERVHGWSRDEVLGKDYLETFFSADLRPLVAADVRKALEGEELRAKDYPIEVRGGTVRTLQWSIGCYRDEHGNPSAAVFSGHDVSEHERRREMLARSETLLQGIIDNSPLTIFVKDLEGTFILTNRSFDEGYPHGKGFAIGKKDADFLPPEAAEQNRTNDKLALDTGAPITFEERIPFKGAWGHYLASKFPLFDAQGKPYAICGIASDITALRQAEAEREKLQAHIIATQGDTLRELSTPLLPIASGVVLMPLVGAIDEGRAARVLETLLDGVVAHRAEVAILDITGVRTVDNDVAVSLVQAAQAAGLLGAEVILTGVGQAAARTLIELGIDMRQIKTLSSLQQGVTYALTRSGRRRASLPRQAR